VKNVTAGYHEKVIRTRPKPTNSVRIRVEACSDDATPACSLARIEQQAVAVTVPSEFVIGHGGAALQTKGRCSSIADWPRKNKTNA